MLYQAETMVEDQRRPPHRLALVTGGLPLGGSTTFLCNLGSELVRRSIPTEVMSLEQQNPLATDFDAARIPVWLTDERRNIFEDRQRMILQRLATFRPTVVLANLSPISFEALRYVPPGIFRIGVAHADQPDVYKTLRRYIPWMDLLAVVSETILRNLKSLPEFAQLPTRYLPLGVPMPKTETASRQFRNALKLLYLGRLDREQKRVHLLPAIPQKLISLGIPFHLTIAGEGPERPALERIFQRLLPPETYSFTGKVPYTQVPNLLVKNDVFLLISDYEGLPLSLVEAMGYGLVPVVSDLPSGIRELVDDNTGKRIDPGNIAGYAEAIAWLHNNRAVMERLSANSTARVRRDFSVEAMTDRWLGALPEKLESEIPWPSNWSIRPPIGGEQMFRFSWAGRLIRRTLFYANSLATRQSHIFT